MYTNRCKPGICMCINKCGHFACLEFKHSHHQPIMKTVLSALFVHIHVHMQKQTHKHTLTHTHTHTHTTHTHTHTHTHRHTHNTHMYIHRYSVTA